MAWEERTMGQQRVERKLAAILAADVVGYSRLMEADEDGTLARLKAHRRELIDPKVREHNGRIIKTTGDGALVEFQSVVNAVRCAVETQQGMIERNAGLPQHRRIEFRIGINLGDIIVEPDDIYGDGVNVAARLEGLAQPGGICISGTVYDHVREKVPYAFADEGEQTVKNISRPVRVFALSAEAVAALATSATIHPALESTRGFRWISQVALAIAAAIVLALGVWLAVRPASVPHPVASSPRLSIVVLPFTNLGGDASQDYLADVITAELTAALSRVPGTFVIAGSTSFTYKGKPTDVRQIGKELSVRYVLEGSAQRSGDRVRVNAQLIDARTGAHLWADQFDEGRADLLTMQDEIVLRLARALQIKLLQADVAHVEGALSSNLDAEDLAMRCEASSFRPDVGLPADGLSLCRRAVQMDERNVRALVLLAWDLSNRVSATQSADRGADIRRADELVSRALAISSDNYLGHCVKGQVLEAQQRFDQAILEAEHCLALNPSYVLGYFYLAVQNFFLGRPEKTLEYLEIGLGLSPRDPQTSLFYLFKGWAYLQLRQYDQSVQWLRRTVAAGAQYPTAQLALASALALSGHDVEARDTIQHYLTLGGTTTKTLAQFKEQRTRSSAPLFLDFEQNFFDGLRKAGIPEE
jgi:adenylate cyclase